jgi:phospholipase C
MPVSDPIKHVVLLMMENHSFDQMLGCVQLVYPALEGIDLDAPTPRMNSDLTGNPVYQIPTDAQQVPKDPNHDTVCVLQQLEGPNLGFVRNYQKVVTDTTPADRQLIMGYYALGRLPALHGLAQEFTVCDHWFSSLPGPTWPNRFFALSGTSSGRVTMPEGLGHPDLAALFAQTQDTLFDRLNEKGKSWQVYYYDFPSSLLLTHQRRPQNLARYERIDRFFAAVRDETTFPAFAFIEPKYFGLDQNDDHPPHNVFKAEKLIADVYNAIRSNDALWENTLLVVVFDEHGGFYDHVSPLPAVPPDDNHQEWTFDRLGVRVPALLISPWVRAGVESTAFDHTSLLKYLIDKWDLGPLGRRTAAANSIAVALDLSTRRQDTLPFIRVPYASLIPENADLESNDTSKHQEALHTFATWLAQTEEVALATAMQALATAAGMWVRFKAALGGLLQRCGRWLEGDLHRIQRERADRTSSLARHMIDKARSQPGAAGGGVS